MAVPNAHFTTLQGAYDVDLMEVTLRVRRYAGEAPRAETKSYTVEVPTTATLLDALDAVKDTRDGTLAYRKSCRMAVCGSCGMRMDGGAVLACKTAMKPFVDAGHAVTVSPMGNLPVIKDLVVDMAPFWHKIHAVKPFLDSSDVEAPEREWRVTPQQSALIAQGVALHHVRLLRVGVQLDGVGPRLPRPRRARQGVPLRRRRARRRHASRALKDLSGAHGIWDCTRCYFCNQRCPKGVDPRDAIAKLGAEAFREGHRRATRAPSHATPGVRLVHVQGRLPARDRAGAEDDRPDRARSSRSRSRCSSPAPARCRTRSHSTRPRTTPRSSASGSCSRRRRASTRAARTTRAHDSHD